MHILLILVKFQLCNRLANFNPHQTTTGGGRGREGGGASNGISGSWFWNLQSNDAGKWPRNCVEIDPVGIRPFAVWSLTNRRIGASCFIVFKSGVYSIFFFKLELCWRNSDLHRHQLEHFTAAIVPVNLLLINIRSWWTCDSAGDSDSHSSFLFSAIRMNRIWKSEIWTLLRKSSATIWPHVNLE